MSWFKKDEPKADKAVEENKRALVSLEQLVQKINASLGKDKEDAMALQAYTDRLRREGSGR